MVRSYPIGNQEILHRDSEAFLKINFGEFVSVDTLLPPYGRSVLVKVVIEDLKEGSKRNHIADAVFYPSCGWEIFDDFFDIPNPIRFSVIAWSWSPIGGKPLKFVIQNKIEF